MRAWTLRIWQWVIVAAGFVATLFVSFGVERLVLDDWPWFVHFAVAAGFGVIAYVAAIMYNRAIRASAPRVAATNGSKSRISRTVESPATRRAVDQAMLARDRSRREQANLGRFLSDLNAGIARALTPDAYRDPPDEDADDKPSAS